MADLEQNEKDRYRTTTIEKVGPRLSTPFFFNHTVYALGAYNPLQVYKFKLDTEGAVTRFGRTNLDVPGYHSYNFHAACVYKNRVYVFYDWDQGGNRFRVRYKTSSDPESAPWEGSDPDHPDDPNAGYSTGVTARYVWWGANGNMDTLKAVVFNDRIYLFYLTDPGEELAYSTFDGDEWKFGGFIRPGKDALKMQPHYAVTTVTLDRKEHLVVCAQQTDDRDKAVFSFLDEKGALSYAKHKVDYKADWVANDDCLSLVAGSIRNGFQDNVLQVFFENSNNASWAQLRRMEINLATGKVSRWVDTEIENRGIKHFQDCDVVPVPITDPDQKSFRHFLVVLTANGNRKHFFSCYPSDHFVVTHEKTKVLISDPKDIGATHLVGIIEGVPPFSRNGAPSHDETSYVKYGKSVSATVSVSTTFEASIGIFGQVGGEVYASFGLTNSFGATNTVLKTVTQTTSIPFTNGPSNPDGEQGFAIVARPILSNRNYKRLSYDRKVNLGTFHVTWIDALDISHERYRLESPWPGIARRSRSSNLDYWRGIRGVPDLPKIPAISLNSMKAVAGMPGQPSSMAINKIDQSEVSGRTVLEFKSGATMKDLYKFEGSASFSITMSQKITSSISSAIEANVRLPMGPIEELVVIPVWRLPKKDATAPRQGSKRPSWIPDRYHREQLVPWCITWRVAR